MTWEVLFHAEFEAEFDELPIEVQDKAYAVLQVLRTFGPNLRRPHVGTLNGSRHDNMKELRFDASSGVWRIAFAFDPNRRAILLVAGDKSGGSERRFYRQFIRQADERFTDHLERLTQNGD